MSIETQGAAAAVQLRCSFCATPSSDVEKIIAGPGVYICNVCVGKCNDVLAAESRKPADSKAQVAEPTAQLAAWGESMTDEQILDLLPRIAAVGTQTEASIQRLIAILRERRITWARIGSALQITRQSAWERFSGEE
ncbi:MAG TPA: ClpX C4-type zinc finger protein [Pseudonocardiaceae bacterium]|jgi:ATP-dependent Clp protease ATP-binding subunit ClpX|nr:ClpX C4-type zinc finger protein [Pseudonocardiaceae bacterium]